MRTCRFKYISNQINITILGTGFCLLEHNGEYLYLTDTEKCFKGLEQRLKLAEGHIEAGRLLAYYQVRVMLCMSDSFGFWIFYRGNYMDGISVIAFLGECVTRN